MEQKSIFGDEKKKNKGTEDHGLIHAEVNCENWPVFALSRETRKLREYERKTGELYQKLTVMASAKYGALTAFDKKTFYALVQIWQEDGRREDGVITFSLYQVVKSLGLTISGKNYSLVKRSILRLATSPLEFTHAFVSKGESGEELLVEAVFHLLRDPIFTTRGEKGQQGFDEFNSVQLDPRLLKNLLSFYTRRLDVGFAFELSEVALLLYAMLDIRTQGAKGARFRIGIMKLAGELNIRSMRVRDIKRVLDKAHEELSAAGYIKRVEYQAARDGGEQVAYTIAGKRIRRADRKALLPSPVDEAARQKATLAGLDEIRKKLGE